MDVTVVRPESRYVTLTIQVVGSVWTKVPYEAS